MKNKAIIIDLDGTAINFPQQRLPNARLVQAIKNLQQYYHVSAATGRVWNFGREVLKGLELVDPCVIAGGTQICQPLTGEILWQKNLSDAAFQKVLAVFKQNPDYTLLCNDATEADYLTGGILPQDLIIAGPVHFIEQIFIPEKIAIQVYQQLKLIDGITVLMVSTTRPGKKDLHVISNEASKEHAITALLKKLGVEKVDAIGIGDGENDLDLFKAVGYKVAMGNAVQVLKDQADEIIGQVTEDGLAAYFERLAAECATLE